MEKIIRDGKVAVLFSPGWGAGWYTWNSIPECVFDPDIVRIVLGEATGDISQLAHEKWGETFYTGGAENLQVEWLPENTPFRIDEYDGNESIVTENDLFFVA